MSSVLSSSSHGISLHSSTKAIDTKTTMARYFQSPLCKNAICNLTPLQLGGLVIVIIPHQNRYCNIYQKVLDIR